MIFLFKGVRDQSDVDFILEIISKKAFDMAIVYWKQAVIIMVSFGTSNDTTDYAAELIPIQSKMRRNERIIDIVDCLVVV